MTVLVTGAFGLVGSSTVTRLAADGQRVVATDLDVPANRKAARRLPAGVAVRFADLTDAPTVERLVAEVAPTAILHLAAVIPPACYARPAVARAVNVDATDHLLTAARSCSSPPRFVQASSIAVHGARNPHRFSDLLTARTPTNPSDIYGAHKVETENLVRASGLDSVILRLGGVLTVDVAGPMNVDNMYFESLLPIDNRITTVDVRDVAAAFAAATTAPVAGETLMIGGDSSHRLRQGDIAPALAAAMGLAGVLPRGLAGDPNDDSTWFATDWMDTARSQEVLDYQRHSWPDLLAEIAGRADRLRPLLRLAAPLARQILRRRSGYYGSGRVYADPWGAIEAKWGDPRPDAESKRSTR
jgi:nucleoside-diphosphate-sugar epimerase